MIAASEADLAALHDIGRIVALTLAGMAAQAQAGMTTAELDAVGARLLAEQGARPTPQWAYRFPGATCISINDEVVHGVPGGRLIRPGDLLKIDLTADRHGYVADATRMVLVPPAPELATRLAACAQSAFDAALGAAVAGNRVCDIGRAVEGEVQRCGFTVIPELAGHGVGSAVHEPPTVPNYYHPKYSRVLTEGLVITIEPIISAGTARIVQRADGWTLATADGSLSAHYEETIVITQGKPLVVTAG